MALTAKQEKFAREWFATGNKSEAYRRAYESSRKWSENAVNVKASELSRNPKVLDRYEELVTAAQERNETDVDTIDRMLKNAYVVAKKDVKPSAMVSAAMGLAKLYGLDAETKARMNDAKSGSDMSEVLRELARRLPD